MMKKLTKDKAPMLPEPQGRHKDMLNKLNIGKALIISEAEKRHIKDVQRIEDTLKAAPDKKKYLALEKDIVFRILRKDIDKANDCYETIVAGQKTRYYRTGQFDYDIEQIKLIRHHYRLYLRGGIVNYAEETLTPKAEPIIDAIRFYQLEAYLNKPKAAPKRTPLQYIDLWKNPEHGTKVKELFESAGITVKGVHTPDPTKCKNPDTELLRAFETLEKLMRYRYRTPAVKCFYNEFHAPVSVSDKTFSSRPDNLQSEEHRRFAKMFASLLR